MRLFTTIGTALLLCPALVGAVRQTPSIAPEPGAFEVELTVHHATVDDKGAEYGPAVPPVRVTLTRARTSAGGWRLIMRSDDTPVGPQRTAAPRSPFAGGRIEIDDDNSPPRLYNARGDRVFADLPVPGFAAATAMQLTDGLVAAATAPAVAARRRALEQHFNSQGRRRGALDVFVRVDGDVREELATEPDTGLPRESTVSRDGEVESRTTFEYQRGADGRYLRRALITESAVPGRRGHRVVTRTVVTRVQQGEER